MRVKLPSLRKKEQCFLALDIGTENVKALIFKKNGLKNIILGTSIEDFDRYGVFDSRDFEIDVIRKAVLKATTEVQKQAKVKTNLVLLGLPAHILKGRVASHLFRRENPKRIVDEKEAKAISQLILKEAQKKILQDTAQQYGILPQDIQSLNSKVLEIKIDGYQVPALLGYDGKNLNFKILNTFLPKYYLKNVEGIMQKIGFENTKIIHEAQGLLSYLNEKPDGIFLDVGGEITQIFLAKNGLLQKVHEFEIGGKAFSQALSERLGLKEQEAKILKERYSTPLDMELSNRISMESQERIKEILWPHCQSWFQTLKDRLKETRSLFPGTIFLFGGGSLLPEIREVLKKGDWQGFSFIDKLEVRFLYPKNLKNIADKTKSLNSPQYVPLLLSCYVI